MRHQWDDLSGSFLAPSEPDPALDCSVLLIVAGRMQGESFRYHLVSRGFEVDLARSVSAAPAPEPPAFVPPVPAAAGVIEHFLFGESEAIRRVFHQVRLVARRDTTVLVTGETGTGKERVSRAIHRMSSRQKAEMVSISC